MHRPTTEPDSAINNRSFFDDVVDGLGRTPKRLPSKYFYDERGSALFDAICELDAYYLTTTELEIMHRCATDMANAVGTGAMLVEYGSGSSLKTRVLLDAMSAPAAYVPVDISGEHLRRTAATLQEAYPRITILPVCADFTQAFDLPTPDCSPEQTIVYFPGSTIGNFHPPDAARLLQRIGRVCGRDGGLLIGIDLQKDRATIEAAYNDSEGVTAAFNSNLLVRINRELDANFDVSTFEHRALYNAHLGRIEMYLVSLLQQTVTIADVVFELAAGEAICTEYSYKHTIDGFAAIAKTAGLSLNAAWTDKQERFAVLFLRNSRV